MKIHPLEVGVIRLSSHQAAVLWWKMASSMNPVIMGMGRVLQLRGCCLSSRRKITSRSLVWRSLLPKNVVSQATAVG